MIPTSLDSGFLPLFHGKKGKGKAEVPRRNFIHPRVSFQAGICKGPCSKIAPCSQLLLRAAGRSQSSPDSFLGIWVRTPQGKSKTSSNNLTTGTTQEPPGHAREPQAPQEVRTGPVAVVPSETSWLVSLWDLQTQMACMASTQH